MKHEITGKQYSKRETITPEEGEGIEDLMRAMLEWQDESIILDSPEGIEHLRDWAASYLRDRDLPDAPNVFYDDDGWYRAVPSEWWDQPGKRGRWTIKEYIHKRHAHDSFEGLAASILYQAHIVLSCASRRPG